LHPQGGGSGIVGGLHVGQQQRGLTKRLLVFFIVPGVGHRVGCLGHRVVQGADRAGAWFPSDIVDGFIRVQGWVLIAHAGVQFLFLEIVRETGCCDTFEAAAYRLHIVHRGNGGEHHRDLGEGGFEGHCFGTGGSRKAAGLDGGAVGQGGMALLHDQVVDGLLGMGFRQVIPFGHRDVKAGFVDIADADGAWVCIVEARRPGDHDRVGEWCGQGDAHPCVADRNLASFYFYVCGGGQFGFRGNDGSGGAGRAFVIRHLQGGGEGGGRGVGVGNRFAAGRAAIAKVPHITADRAVAVGRIAAVEGDGEGCRTGGRCRADHRLGRFVRCRRRGDDDRGGGRIA